MASRPRLDGKVALVTGAASGLGLVSATRFGEEGARVVCVDIEGAGEAADRVAATGADSIAVAADVTDPGAIDGAVAATLERFGRLDVVLANAGIAGSGMAHATTPEQWERVIGVNLTGVFLTIRAVLPQLMERRAGSVVATSSLAAISGVPSQAAYAAVVLRAYEQIGGDVQEMLAARAGDVPLGRLGEPLDVANLALFLASDESAWMTGTVLPLDGGLSAAMVPRFSPPAD
jgi:3-oxoacyl-[acyl-carrier protein] reductase